MSKLCLEEGDNGANGTENDSSGTRDLEGGGSAVKKKAMVLAISQMASEGSSTKQDDLLRGFGGTGSCASVGVGARGGSINWVVYEYIAARVMVLARQLTMKESGMSRRRRQRSQKKRQKKRRKKRQRKKRQKRKRRQRWKKTRQWWRHHRHQRHHRC